MKQGGATLVFDLGESGRETVEALVDVIRSPNDLDTLDKLHYASFSIVPLGTKGEPNLLIELNFDGEFDDLVERLAVSPWIRQCMEAMAIAGDLKERLVAANRGEGNLFVALRGATVSGIRRRGVLLGVTRLKKYEIAAANARDLVQQLKADPEVGAALEDCRHESIPRESQAAGMLVPGLFNLAGFVVASTLILGSSIPLHGSVWQACAAALVAMLTSINLGAGGAMLWFGRSRSARLIGGLSLASGLAIIAGTTLPGYMSPVTWIGYYVLLISVILVPAVAISLVPKTAPLDRFVAVGVATLGTVLIVLLLLGMMTGRLPFAASLITFSLSLVAMLYLGVRRASSSPFAAGLLYGIPLAMTVALVAPAWAVWTSTLIIVLLVLLTASFGLLLCRFEAHERERSEVAALWMPDECGNKVLLQEATRPRLLNHLLSVTKIRGGRDPVLRLVLRLIMLYQSIKGQRGQLSGITTIHFARWIIVDDKLVFLSNYDHAWGAYLDEFIDQASAGLTAIWSQTEGFPLTHWLTGGGADYAQRFKSFARQSQHPVLLHYAGYPEYTVDDIEVAENVVRILTSSGPTDADCEYIARTL